MELNATREVKQRTKHDLNRRFGVFWNNMGRPHKSLEWARIRKGASIVNNKKGYSFTLLEVDETNEYLNREMDRQVRGSH